MKNDAVISIYDDRKNGKNKKNRQLVSVQPVVCSDQLDEFNHVISYNSLSVIGFLFLKQILVRLDGCRQPALTEHLKKC